MNRTIIIDGGRADSYYGSESHLDRLIHGEIVRQANDDDLQDLRARTTVYMRNGAQWGSGEYTESCADRLYVMEHGFNLGHLEMALRRMADTDRQAKLDNLYARIDA